MLVGAGLAALGALVGAGVYGAQQMTRPPRLVGASSAASHGLPEPVAVTFPAADGVPVPAWWFEAPGGAGAGTVIVCHGHGGDKASSEWVALGLYPTHGVLLIDTRGHGEHTAARTSVGYLERLDVLGAVRWVKDRWPDERVGLLGISMGGAACILAAAECPDVAAVVAESAFARLRIPLACAIGLRGYPRPLRRPLAWAVCATAPWLHGTVRARWQDPISAVHRLAPRPLLLIHGGADQLTPVSEAYALYRAAGEPKELWVEPGVGHTLMAEVHPAEYDRRVRRFFGRWLGPV